ncbi:MAG: hypothetical protein ACERKN_15935 [Velocimicrobium sp.]
MASYFGISGDSTSFFSSYFGTSSTEDSSSSTPLSDYAMIQSGAYKKLLNAYYGTNSSTANSTQESESDTKNKVNLTETKSAATTLEKAATTLKNGDFSESDQVTENVQAFVDAYNETIDSASDVDAKSVLHKTLWMIGNTNASTNLLKDVGITVAPDNKLSLNTDTLKNADESTLKTLFSGTNSFSGKIASKATDLVNLSSRSMKALTSTGSAYTNSGDYSSVNTSNLYDSLF